MSELRTEFERLHCGGNPHLTRRDSTTGDYVLPSINDAWAGFQSGHAAGLEQQAKRIAELEAGLADAHRKNERLSGEREQLNEQLRKMGADWLATAINGAAESLPAARIRNLVEQNGSYRKVGELLGVDHAYLHRIAHGEKDNMSDEMLKKIGLRRGTFYAALDKETKPESHSSNALGGPTAASACEQLLGDYRNGIPIKVSPETHALAEKVVASKSVLEMSDQELRDWAHGMTHNSNEDARTTGESDRTSDS